VACANTSFDHDCHFKELGFSGTVCAAAGSAIATANTQQKIVLFIIITCNYLYADGENLDFQNDTVRLYEM
jgi:hypothetical protein